MPADSPRRFRIPGPFVWSGSGNLYVTESRTPASDAVGWKMQVERFDSGERFLAQVHHKVTRDAAWSEHGSFDEAKAWCEAEVARVAASMMVEVEPEEG